MQLLINGNLRTSALSFVKKIRRHLDQTCGGLVTDIGSLIVQRPPIVLTSTDRDRLFALLDDATETLPSVACFLREELERADIVSGGMPLASLVTMGSDVKFIDHESTRIRRRRLVYPDEANEAESISVLTPIGSALLGLGPGQSISWTEVGEERRLTVLEVHPRSDQRGR
jgi:regulator of nucleoside diphosphate kinase